MTDYSQGCRGFRGYSNKSRLFLLARSAFIRLIRVKLTLTQFPLFGSGLTGLGTLLLSSLDLSRQVFLDEFFNQIRLQDIPSPLHKVTIRLFGHPTLEFYKHGW